MPVIVVQSKEQLNNHLQNAGEKLVVIDFFAHWCGPCKKIAPFVEKLSTQYSEKVVFLKVDVDECTELAEEYGIKAMPTFKFLRNKAVKYELEGADSKTLECQVKHFSS